MRKLILSLMCVVFVFISPVFANEESVPIGITVVVPGRAETRPQIVEPPVAPEHPHLYPVQVWENRENDRRELIRVYELTESENPHHIPREPFTRDGFLFELAEIVRRDVPAYDTKNHVETVEVSTETNDLETVIKMLSNSLEFLSDDGYFGILSLDVSSITIESQGTTSRSSTVTRTREYPHLSSADTSLVPRTITDGGRTYNLSNVDWRAQNMTTVDYTQLPASYTAVATYTRTATSVSTIGYTTTAEYKGSISRVGTGRTEFTAYYIGTPIVTNLRHSADTSVYGTAGETCDSSSIIPSMRVDQVHVGGISIAVQSDDNNNEPILIAATTEANDAVQTESEEENSSGLSTFFVILLIAVFSAIAFCVGKFGKALIGLFKKSLGISCLCILLSIPLNANAAQLPGYVFGSQNSEPALHFDTRAFSQSTAETHINPASLSLSSDIENTYQDGDYIGELTVERLNRRINIFAGESLTSMDRGGGHFSYTGLNHGNTGLVGHNRGRSNGHFIFVKDLREGDVLTLDAAGIVMNYTVTMVYTVDEDDFAPLLQYGDSRLTLITCVENQRHLRRVAVAIAADI